MPRHLHPLTTILITSLTVLSMVMLVGCTRKNDLSGTWKGKITLPDTGKSLSDLEFFLNQKGRELTGSMIFTKPGAKLPLTGTEASGKITLSAPMKNGLAVTIVGTLENKKTIKGTAVLDYDTPQLGKKQDRALLEMTR
jgi:hypothetical protein